MKQIFFFHELKKSRLGRMVGAMLAFLLLASGEMRGQCNPDVTAPTAVCVEVISIVAGSNGLATVTTANIDDGSYDDCGPVTLLLSVPGLPAGTSIDLPIGTHTVTLTVEDPSGNSNSCLCTVEVVASCVNDVTPPTLTAPADLTLALEDFTALGISFTDLAALDLAFGAATATDNCVPGNVSVSASANMLNWQDGAPRRLTRSFWAADASLNTATAKQFINIKPSYTIHVPAWGYPGSPTSDSMTVSQGPGYLMGVSFYDVGFPAECDPNELVKLVVNWSAVNWYGWSNNGPATTLPALDIDGDGQLGDAYDVQAWGDSIYLLQNGIRTTALGLRNELYEYAQLRRFNNLDAPGHYVSGKVFLDQTEDCAFNAGEESLANWKVKAVGSVSGRVYTDYTDANGIYQMLVCAEDTSVNLSLDVSFNYGGACGTTYFVQMQPPGAIASQDIPVYLDLECPLLSVDIATDRLRPCFQGTYNVNYCNLYADTIADAHIIVTLDTFVSVINTSIPGINLGGNQYDFYLNPLLPGECGLFEITFLLDCNAPAGLTHCSEAQIFPSFNCGEASATWNGSNLVASAKCVGSNVEFTITNDGYGPMLAPVDFVVVEDMILMNSHPVNLGAGNSTSFEVPAGSNFLRVEGPQEPGHPFGGLASAFVEGCDNNSAPGLPVMFSNNGASPSASEFCLQNVSSFDPNDKAALPVGYGTQHLVERGTDLEYLIRFQNTGTDVAYTIVLLDTLDGSLDAASIRPGASSHPYSFEILNNQVLRFTFDNVLLPAMSVNEPGSHGFVKFRAAQKPALPNGTVIENSAAIYFDFNAPVITNTVSHQIGENFITLNTGTAPEKGAATAWPNPVGSTAWLELPVETQNAIFRLTDQFGRIVLTRQFSGKTCRLERPDLPAGIYPFTVSTQEGGVFSGKIMLK